MKKLFIIFAFLFAISLQAQPLNSLRNGANTVTTRINIPRNGWQIDVPNDSIVKHVKDSVAKMIRDSLNGINRNGGALPSADSLARLVKREIVFVAYFTALNSIDTSNFKVFAQGGNTAANSMIATWRVPISLILDKIIISHSYDTTYAANPLTGVRQRDSIVIPSNKDSIPAGASFGCFYVPALLNFFGVPLNYQSVTVIYHNKNDVTSENFAGQQIQVPLILGVQRPAMGFAVDHKLSMTLVCYEKIPGRIY